MAHTFTSVHLHLIFSTAKRQPFMDAELRSPLHAYLGGTIRGLGGVALLVNGVEDHVHILSSLPSTIALSDFMRDLKANATNWVKETYRREEFGWQTG